MLACLCAGTDGPNRAERFDGIGADFVVELGGLQGAPEHTGPSGISLGQTEQSSVTVSRNR